MEIDGPYSAPAQDYKNYAVLLLVGLGIGATPFISIIKDILLNHHHKNSDIEKANNTTNRTKTDARAVEKAYFYWSAREAESFKWFPDVMSLVAEQDRSTGVVEVHNHCTSVYEERDAKSGLIALLQTLYYAKKGKDVVSEGKVQTHFGRPEWLDVFDRVARKHPGQRVGKFLYCALIIGLSVCRACELILSL